MVPCLTCGFFISILLSGPDHRRPGTPLVGFYLDAYVGKEATHWRAWQTMLDPHSYGHFADADTKNITWCDDRSCPTSFELMQFGVFLNLVLPTPRMKIQEKQPFKKRLDYITCTKIHWLYNPQAMPPYDDCPEVLYEILLVNNQIRLGLWPRCKNIRGLGTATAVFLDNHQPVSEYKNKSTCVL